MCGIYGYFQLNQASKKKISLKKRQQLFLEFSKTQHRGPDHSIFKSIDNNTILGFHRLCIVGIEDGNQPFYKNNVYCICNGEIYNHKELRTKYNLPTCTGSDCEVILHLFLKFGIEKTCTLLDGVFAFLLYDTNTYNIYIGRDRIGVRSLYYNLDSSNNILCVSSEMKSIGNKSRCAFFPPGSYAIYAHNTLHINSYYITTYNNPTYKFDTFEVAMRQTRYYFEKAIQKRLMSERPIGCLLSGGLDSSLVAALVAKIIAPKRLHTFSIGMKGATDLYYAKMVATHINSIHHEVYVTKEEMLNTLPRTVYSIESWDTTTIRASTPMILLCDYIKEKTDITVIYSGEGSDEASGSYMYFHNAPSTKTFQNECVRLVKDLQYFDVLRSDKSVSAAGLEVRVPFLDNEFLEYYMSISPEYKQPSKNKNIEKYLLRKAFDDGKLLPKEVLWRTKEAFSDGCSSQEDSWNEIIQKYTDSMTFDNSLLKNCEHPPEFKEAMYYRQEFLKHFPDNVDIIPYYWLPKWSGDVKDPSARILDVYSTDSSLNQLKST
jgi:asparagine synthase (glutamine-hydrolysing)